jgi:hypothetical protein
MIELILRNTGERLDLPKDLKLSVERSNAFFEETGSFSLPFNIPCTSRNLKILNFPHEMAQRDYRLPQPDVILNISSFQFAGKLKLLTVSAGEIQAAIMFDNSDLYARIGSRMLPDMFADVIWDDAPDLYPGDEVLNRKTKTEWWLMRLTECMAGAVNGYPFFKIFPVMCTGPDTKGNEDSEIYINQPAINSPLMQVGGIPVYPLASAMGEITTDMSYSFEAGYECSPFLTLSWLLRKIFEKLGYGLAVNAFDSDSDLQKIVLLNNTRDSLMAGKIYASHLLPDCSVSDLLLSIRNKFGCEFVVRNNFKTADIVFLKDILSAAQPGREDFTPLTGDACTVEYQPRKALKLTANALEKQFTPYYTFETYQQLIERFGSDVRLDKALNSYFIEYRSRDTNDLFSYIENPDSLEIEEKKPESVDFHLIENFQDGLDEPVVYPLPSIGKIRSKTTQIEFDGKSLNSDEDLSIFFCRANGQLAPVGTPETHVAPYVFFGSTCAYSGYRDTEIGNLNLVYEGEKGLYNNFWKEYGASLKKGMHRVSTKLNLTPNGIMNYNLYRQVIINGVRMLPVKIQYEITAENIQVVNAEFITV